MNSLYTATALAHGGRQGKVESTDGVINMDLRMPKELGGQGGEATNPEQLFAAGYAACFDSALNMVARMKRIKIKDTVVEAQVSIGKEEDGAFGLSAKLFVTIPDIDQESAEELVKAAHETCPYSRATRGNMEVELTTNTK
ncbi:organic hydroperoxide resistance protein [Guptibacillus algicola]|uniref:organic hydroperoxide resistance protein n=1 Tax=Guptibacillus algicola TaxID=225844 RepID=UPI001CD367DC|nr:organic hydroperoxide resistance protein [Alkalihalobacillus algicola]MCA0987560.1 organic hydroperoxide resistance protein [Alkalihalobacillus algicola]